MKTQIDIFNGDADGICALIQLRLDSPKPDARLITGVKRDISLVKQVKDEGPVAITVLDISLDKNRDAVEELLATGCQINYIDHHFAGEQLPINPNFLSHINTQSTTCTSLIVNELLNGQYVNWAITAAFGDNLHEVAGALAAKSGLSANESLQLELLGTCFNYNGYGATEADLHFKPAELYKIFCNFRDPLEIIKNNHPAWKKLKNGYENDLELAQAAKKRLDNESLLIIELPDEAWARRVSGVYGNQLANENPDRAIAVLTKIPEENYLVSLRAPLNNRTGADDVARKFETGGGRKAAAGINQLPIFEFDRLVSEMNAQWAE